MKISGPSNKSGVVQPAGRSGGKPAGTSVTPAGGDHIQLSGLAALSQAISSQHGIKLSGLADAVSAGRYRPDASAVSISIIQDSLAAA
jgi:hypothetical protein